MKHNSTRLEELFNALSHAIGAVLALVGTIYLIRHGSHSNDAYKTASMFIYGIAMISVYVASTMYHSLFFSRVKKLFRIIDHTVIYFYIAASYTAFAFYLLHGIWIWALLVAVWTVAVIGIGLQIFRIDRYRLNIAVYLLFSLFSLLAAPIILKGLPFASIGLLIAGGVLLLVGFIFYLWRSLYFNHGIWHLFVMGDTFCHLGAMFFLR